MYVAEPFGSPSDDVACAFHERTQSSAPASSTPSSQTRGSSFWSAVGRRLLSRSNIVEIWAVGEARATEASAASAFCGVGRWISLCGSRGC